MLGLFWLPIILMPPALADGEATTIRSEGYSIALAREDCVVHLRDECPDGQHVYDPTFDRAHCEEETDENGVTWWTCGLVCYGRCTGEDED